MIDSSQTNVTASPGATVQVPIEVSPNLSSFGVEAIQYILSIDPASRTAIVQPGVRNLSISDAAAAPIAAPRIAFSAIGVSLIRSAPYLS